MAVAIHIKGISNLLKVYGGWDKEEGFDFEPFKTNTNYDILIITKNN